MMRYSSSSSQVSPDSIITAVDCQNQVRSWRLLRSLMEFLIPTCKCVFVEDHEEVDSKKKYIYQAPSRRYTNKTISVTGTMFGYRGEKIYFCFQRDLNASPSLLLELVVPNKTLAREMKGGVLHIDLNNETMGHRNGMVWTMYCNGKRVGFAVRRRPTVEDLDMIRGMGSVEIGAGTVVTKGRKELMYLRARFERGGCGGPLDVESFHLIDPEGCIGQELSITFHR